MMSPSLSLPRPLTLVLALAAATAPLEAGGQTYAVNPAASHVRLHLGRSGLMKFLGHDHEIEAPIGRGSVEVVEGDPTRSRVTLRFEAVRLAIVPGSEPADDIPKVEERMRGPEVLDAARYPEISFVSTAVKKPPKDGAEVHLVVAGTLTLRGRSFPVEVPLDVERDGTEIEARGGVDLRLRDLGIEPPSVAGVVKVADRFRLEFAIRASTGGPR
jgi:polyisoprenoid-binding protein YceI